MLLYELEDESGSVREFALLVIFTLDGQTYAAMVPARDGAPIQADISLFACEGPADDLEFYDILYEDEYAAVSDAFYRVVDALSKA